MGDDVTLTETPDATNGAGPQDAQRAATDAKALATLKRMQRIARLRSNDWKVELSGGQWAVLSDPETLPERKARAIKVAMVRSTPSAPTSDTGSIAMDADAVIDSGYILVAAFLSAWSLGELPSVGNFDRLLDLPSRDYAALQTVCEDLKEEAMTDFSPTPEATSPFVPQSD